MLFPYDVLVDSWPTVLVGLVLFGLAFDFLVRFPLRSWKRLRSLRRIVHALRHDTTSIQRHGPDLYSMVGRAVEEPIFPALWREYSKTLHGQRGVDEQGQQIIVRWRATTMAENYFTEQALVNSPLQAEYFKHLPGILTGLGIIGTFSGLIRGLSHFHVSLDPADAQRTLANLIRAVGHAFYVSGAAVALAILFTWIEKLSLSACYARVERIQLGINRLFQAGAGEEYLERLVRACETSATQALHIKEALVADLKQILQEVTSQQVAASASDSRKISAELGGVIAKTLSGPIDRIAQAVDRVGSGQGEAINTMLVDVLTHFSERIKEIFGSEMRGMSDLLIAMQTTAKNYEGLAASIDSAAKNAADTLAERLSEAVASMETRQHLIAERISELFERISALISQSQSAAGEQIQQSLSHLGSQVVDVIAELQEQARNSLERQNHESARFVDQTGATVMGLSREMEALVRQSGETSRSLQTSVAALAGVTQDSLAKMNSGAELLYAALGNFNKAGEYLTTSVNRSSSAIDRIDAASRVLGGAMNGATEVLDDYKKSRDSFGTMLSDLKSTILNAKKEASVNSDLIEKLRGAATQLASAEKQSEQYLEGINKVLAEAHKSFAENLDRTLGHGNARFHEELSQAVGLLSAGIQDLEVVVDRIPVQR